MRENRMRENGRAQMGFFCCCVGTLARPTGENPVNIFAVKMNKYNVKK